MIEEALFLFDNNQEKAEVFTNLLNSTFYKFREESNLRMDFSEPSCRWCSSGDCWVHMPDSKTKCEHGKKDCPLYENRQPVPLEN